MRRPDAFLLDIDGTIAEGRDREPLPGAVAAVRRLSAIAPVRYVTNATSSTPEALSRTLADAGFPVDSAGVTTPLSVARDVLTERGDAEGIALGDPRARAALEWFRPTEPERARAVLIATEGHDLRIGDLQPALRALLAGARLYALQSNRIFPRDGRMHTDVGPVAALLAYAAEVDWVTLGKPSPLVFERIAAELGRPLDALAMVGDDAEFDCAGALRAGVGTSVLLRTGKYLPGDEGRVSPRPTVVLDDLDALVRALS